MGSSLTIASGPDSADGEQGLGPAHELESRLEVDVFILLDPRASPGQTAGALGPFSVTLSATDVGLIGRH